MLSQNAPDNEVKASVTKDSSPSTVGVGKDNDGLISSMSVATSLSIPENAKKIINSKEDEGREQMIIAATELMVYLYNNFPERLKNINCPELNDLDFENKEVNRGALRETMRDCVMNNFNIENFGAGRAYDCYLAFKINTPRHITQPLSPQWSAVSEKYNVSPQFAAAFRDTVKEEGNLIGFRLDEKAKTVVQRPSGAKAGYIWFKVGNYPPFLNRIPLNQQYFGNPDAQGNVVPGAHTKVTANMDKYPDLIKTQVMTYTLQELIQGVKDKSFIIDKSLSNDERICFRPVPGVNGNPRNQNIVFSLKLGDQAAMKMMSADAYASIANNQDYVEKIKYNKDISWNNKWGSIEDALKYEYNLQSDVSGVGNDFVDVLEVVVPLRGRNVNNVFKPVQHSFECYNPYFQSNVNGAALFAGPDGEPRVRQDFKGVTNYLDQQGKDQVMHINQHWDMTMERCGQVVEAQINLASAHIKQNKLLVPIEPSTINAFVKSIEKDKQYVLKETSFESLLNIVKHLDAKGAESRILLCNYLVTQMQKPEGMPYKRELVNDLIDQVRKDAKATNEQPNLAKEALTKLINTAAGRKLEQSKGVESQVEQDYQARSSPGMKR